jgi:S1-C subfamily serine protease
MKFAIAIAFLLSVTYAECQVTSNLINRTVMIKHLLTGGGSGFFLEYKGQQYIITAAHVLPGFKAGENLTLVNPASLAEVQIGIKEVIQTGGNDVIVLKPTQEFFETLSRFPVVVGDGSSYLVGESVFFAGYPLATEITMRVEGERRLVPFVKRANVALIAEFNGGRYLFLDGINTPGFSGGPIFKIELNSGKTYILGVVSGYKNEPKRVLQGTKETDFWVNLNSGIIVAHPISVVIDAIEQHLNRLATQPNLSPVRPPEE